MEQSKINLLKKNQQKLSITKIYERIWCTAVEESKLKIQVKLFIQNGFIYCICQKIASLHHLIGITEIEGFYF